ncbi:cache domain-containing protein [Marinobacter xestospongiae]|uniref:cache domain-containing protein n=1 Tax=Marinobacter xestospongiae TaxID=994319 RepID=UPI0020032600|nr:cache and HAMP domain-containing protein [Marinobacter xestospongiae]MCK7565602.1 cache and HAMP domain-containing protein [Marinobacter xestospongiae]
MSIYQRVIAACTGLVLLAIVSMTYLSYQKGSDVVSDSVRERLNAIATHQQGKIAEVILAWQDRVALIASRTQLRISLQRYGIIAQQSDQDKMAAILADAQQSVRAVRSIQVSTLDGRVVASAGEPIQTIARMIEFSSRENSPGLINLASDQTGHLFATLSQAMVIDDVVVGKVQVTLSADELLRTTADTTGLGQTGETLLTARNRQGEAYLLTPLRHRPEFYLQPLRELSSPFAASLNGKSNATLEAASDYRDTVTMVALRPLPTLDWQLAVKMDHAEILAPVSDFRTTVAMAAISLLIAALLLGVLIARAIAGPVTRLAEESRRILGGEYDLRTTENPQAGREILDLSRAINELTDMLIHTNASLERRVAARTQELEQLNETLERRILEQVEARQLIDPHRGQADQS